MDEGDSEVYLGDRIKVRTMLGDRGNVIGQLPDGRAILFSRESPYRDLIGIGQEVDCHVVHIAHNYVIVEPISEPTPISEVVSREDEPPQEAAPREDAPPRVDEHLIENLEMIAEESGWDATVARALLHIIRRLDRLSRAR